MSADSSDFSTIKPWVSSFDSADFAQVDVDGYVSLLPVVGEIVSPCFGSGTQGLFSMFLFTSVNINAP